jgi:gentisate 1,2-dioxygenase
MVAPGAHINAIGAIVPTGAEVAGDLVNRCTLVVADSIPQAQNLSRELIDSFGSRGKWHDVQRLSTIVAERRAGHGARGQGDLTLFKSLGIGIADLAIGAELVRKAHELRVGRRMARPEPAEPRLRRGTNRPARRDFTFVDRTGAPAPKHQPAPPVVIRNEDIEAEVARLASLPPPANGRRVSAIVNSSAGVGNGLAPGIAVSLSVLKPGERTRPARHNASLIEFCIRGGGTSIVDGKRIRFSQYDVWNVPTWSGYEHINDTNDLQVRLTYSNSALLETLNVHVVDEELAEAPRGPQRAEESASATAPATFPLTDDGAMLMAYEKLINPDIVSMAALHWPWKRVKEKLDELNMLGRSYVGRRLYLLYNPATGRTNGTSQSFFATM